MPAIGNTYGGSGPQPRRRRPAPPPVVPNPDQQAPAPSPPTIRTGSGTVPVAQTTTPPRAPAPHVQLASTLSSLTPAQRLLAPYAVVASHIYGVPAADILALAKGNPKLAPTKRLPTPKAPAKGPRLASTINRGERAIAAVIAATKAPSTQSAKSILAAAMPNQSAKAPVFNREGPGLYAKAAARNAAFAKPGPYKTKLSPFQEQRYQAWLSTVPKDIRPPANGPSDYDMRGYFKATGGKGWKPGDHFPDTFKTPRDTTFSRESKYATKGNPLVWRGDKLVNRDNQRVVYAPKQGPSPKQKARKQAKRTINTLAKQTGGPDARVLFAADVRLAKKYGVPASVLASQQNIESGLGANTVGPPTPYGRARGDTQFIQSTRDSILAKHGVDAYAGPKQAAKAQALLLRDSGYAQSPQSAIFSYNHSQTYVNDVLQGAKAFGVLDHLQSAATTVPKQTLTRFQAIMGEAKRIDSAKLPYSYGAGHVAGHIPGPKRTTYDCSSVTSKVLQSAGLLPGGAMVSGDFTTYGKPGPGAVTIYANSEHVFMKIGNRYFGTSHSNPGGGAGFIPTSYEKGEAASGKYVVRHVPGLGQDVAAALGVRGPISGGGSSPGLSYSAGGTTATVTGGTLVNKPGISSRPPRFSGTPAQVAPSALAPSAPLPFGFQGNYTQTDLANALAGRSGPKRRLAAR